MMISTAAAFLGATEEDAKKLCPIALDYEGSPSFPKRQRWIANFMKEVERLDEEQAAESNRIGLFHAAETVQELKDWINTYMLNGET